MKKQGWDDITQIRKNTQSEENRRNIGDMKRHQERLEMLKKIEESIPEEQAEIEEKISKLMEIEQADTLVIVQFKLYYYFINKNNKNFLRFYVYFFKINFYKRYFTSFHCFVTKLNIKLCKK